MDRSDYPTHQTEKHAKDSQPIRPNITNVQDAPQDFGRNLTENRLYREILPADASHASGQQLYVSGGFTALQQLQGTAYGNGVQQDTPSNAFGIIKPVAYHGNAPVAPALPETTWIPTKQTYMQKIPEYAYNMPHGQPLNFTMVEMLVLLPNWFKMYPQLAYRFLNNGLTARMHLTIMQQHRVMALNEDDLRRLKGTVSDGYRRVMRRVVPTWSMTAHKPPKDWDETMMSVNHLSHDKPRPSLVPFKVLMDDIKQLPQGPDAGDLTRALEFALSKEKPSPDGTVLDWMFPQDLHVILGFLGYTKITQAHFDTAAIKRYNDVFLQQKADERKRRRESEEREHSAPPSKHQQTAADTYSQGNSSHPYGVGPNSQALPQNIDPGLDTGLALPPNSTTAPVFQPSYGIENVASNPTVAATQPAPADGNSAWWKSLVPTTPPMQMEQPTSAFDQCYTSSAAPGQNSIAIDGSHLSPTAAVSPDPDYTSSRPNTTAQTFTFTQEELDACLRDDAYLREIDEIIAQNQTFDFTSLLSSPPGASPDYESEPDAIARIMQTHKTKYPLTQLLRDCAEADDDEDQGVLARAARWCRDSQNCAEFYTVGDLDFVVTLQDMMADKARLCGETS